MPSEYLKRILAGEPIIRLGHIWYGVDSRTTVTSVVFSPSQNVQTVRGLRTDAALAFSPRRRPPEKTVVVTIVVAYDAFPTHIQEFEAMLRVTPIISVQGSLINTLIDPAGVRAEEGVVQEHFMVVDNVEYSTIDAAPRDIRMTVILTKVATPFLKDDTQRYIKTLDGALRQAEVMQRMKECRGDSPTIEAIATMLGVNVDKYQQMVYAMRNRGNTMPLYSSRAIIRDGSRTGILGVYKSANPTVPLIYVAPLDTDVGIPLRGDRDAQLAPYVRPDMICWCETHGCDMYGYHILTRAEVLSLSHAEALKLIPVSATTASLSGRPIFLKE